MSGGYTEFGKPVRLDINGLGSLVNGRDIVLKIIGLIDSMSVSLNASDSDTYMGICHSVFRDAAYSAVLEFIRECLERIPGVTVSIVGGFISPKDEDR